MTSWNTFKLMNENSPLPTIKSWLRDAVRQLKNEGIVSAQLDAELLLAHTLRQPRTWLHAHEEEVIDLRTQEILQARLDLRLDRVPVAYIIGHKEFYGYRFKVTTATLIPRPESEVLIELLATIIPTHRQHEPLRLVDVGTGSGCLGIVAKLQHPELDVTLIDQSRYALSVAEKNARELHADVETLISDLLDAYPHTADIIIANLPYVDPEWDRSPETTHEPADALFAADHGLALIYKLIRQTRSKLSQHGHLILEADPTQHEAIKKEAALHGLICADTRDYGLLFERLR